MIKRWKLLIVGFFGTIFMQFILTLGTLAIGKDMRLNLDGLNGLQMLLVGVYSLYGLMTAITEELYFRYLFFSTVKQKLARLLILFISSALFGLAHYWQVTSFDQLLSYFVAGLFLGFDNEKNLVSDGYSCS
ncbi:CPBP family intramembrane glutamic endopeptidase [Listeria sp. PSOL-1]|uniref:CPBP family intramembrane glutamic endopeptidase n=1 Tax=Listeria sp. PSOL-1 TaxID=1844999 RepID=UPI0013D029C7|nr:CPBP family intramembrane glutamic endopeptidase [Listeria sp. PSOL-1]